MISKKIANLTTENITTFYIYISQILYILKLLYKKIFGLAIWSILTIELKLFYNIVLIYFPSLYIF